jgi:hypothetical protein
MKCEDLLPSLETGGPLRRMRARRHAARCPRCSPVCAAFGQVKRGLASPQPLSPRALRAWRQACGESSAPLPARAGRRMWIPLAGGLAAAGLVWIVIGRFARPEAKDTRPVPPAAGDAVVEVIDPATELARLAKAVDELDEQVQQLKEQAARRAAQHAVALAIDRFGRW